MLVLSRRDGERIRLGDSIVVTVVRVSGDRVRLGIEAPPHVRVDRQEIYEKIEQQADVLAAVGEGAGNDAPPTVVSSGADTATLVTKPGPAQPQPVSAQTLNKLAKYPLPRKPR